MSKLMYLNTVIALIALVTLASCGGKSLGEPLNDGEPIYDAEPLDKDAPLGKAESPGQEMCGGFAGLPCPDGYTCVDDPSDDCDPQNGGADCAGLCQEAPAGGVFILIDKTTYTVGESAWATVDNQSADRIFLSGCSQVNRQLLENGQWVDKGGQKFCLWEGVAVEVPASSLYTEPNDVRFSSPGTWRVVAEYGLGCNSGLPLSGAGCSSFEIAASEPVTVVSTPQMCGGLAGLPCPDGYTCVDDPSDDCDPQNGGADCAGLCQEAPEGGVFILTDKDTYMVEESAWATVDNQSADSIFLSGCSQVNRQLLENGQWVDKGPQLICVWQGVAVEVPASTYYTVHHAVRFSSPGTWRVVAGYGLGCNSGLPLSGATCSSIEIAASEPVTVVSPEPQMCAGFAGLPCPNGYECVDDPSDDCDPQNGGADCSGLCQETAAGDVFILTDKNTYTVGESAWATVDNQSQENLFLSGCTQVARQLLENGLWVDMGRLTACFWEGVAVEVPASTLFTEPTDVRFTSPGTWRVVAEYGLECTSGLPLSGASCTSFEIAASEPVTVVP